MTKAVILAAHGSRLPSSNQEVFALAQQWAEQLPQYRVVPAFLELASPSITESARQLLDQGCHQLLIIPFFLAAGTHVSHDLPAIVRQLCADYPGAEIHCTAHLGASPTLLQALGALLPDA